MMKIKTALGCFPELFSVRPTGIRSKGCVFEINMSMWFAAFFIVSINTGAYMAETVRGGILSIDPGQTEGAKAISMTHVQTMLYAILP